MSKTVKVPKEIQELFFEAAAAVSLSIYHSKWLIPSPKAFYYSLRGEKLDALAWRTLNKLFLETGEGSWRYDINNGIAYKIVAETPKPPRAPRVAKPKTEPTT